MTVSLQRFQISSGTFSILYETLVSIPLLMHTVQDFRSESLVRPQAGRHLPLGIIPDGRRQNEQHYTQG